jgi:cyanate lyase
MTREDLTIKIQNEKRSLGLCWKKIAEEIGPGSPILYTAALLGQMTLTKSEAENASKLLSLSSAETTLLTESPNRGSLNYNSSHRPSHLSVLRTGPDLGTTWKALIEEEFGDGIMSAIDFEMQIEREPNPKGDRVKLPCPANFCPTNVIRSALISVTIKVAP